MSISISIVFKRGVSLINSIFCYLIGKIRYKKFGWSSRVIKPILVTPRFIEIGNSVLIYWHGRIQAVPNFVGENYKPRIIIEDGVGIQQNLHLTCANYVKIGKDTSISANVTITDINHPYKDVTIPSKRQKLEVGSVEIGEQCTIYNNAVILPNVKLGKHVVVGANCVVNGNIPDYSVVVGNPAVIIKRYDTNSNTWRKTDKKGVFID